MRARLSGFAATRLASSSDSICMKSLFIRNRRCKGTVVVKRFSALIFGRGKSKSLKILVQLVAAHFAVDRAAL